MTLQLNVAHYKNKSRGVSLKRMHRLHLVAAKEIKNWQHHDAKYFIRNKNGRNIKILFGIQSIIHLL